MNFLIIKNFFVSRNEKFSEFIKMKTLSKRLEDYDTSCYLLEF